MYIAVVYIMPENSTHARHDPFGLLQNDIAYIPPESQILLCGDYNAHTSIESDFVDNIDTGSDGELADYLCDINSERSVEISAMMEKKLLVRFSQDKKNVDNHGKLLLELCKAVGMLILNGRLGANKGIGRCTRIADNSSSVVDYVIATPDLFDHIDQFQVNSKFPESDHLPISFSLKTILSMAQDTDSEVPGWEPTKRYKWSPYQLNCLKTIMGDDLSRVYQSEVRKSLAELQGTNDVAQAISTLITQAADRAFPVC